MVNRTPKSAVKQVEPPKFNDYFEAMKTGESVVTTPADKGPDVSSQLSELMKRVDALQAENAQFRNYQQQPQQVVVQQQTPANHQQQEAPMPDAVLEPEAYANWLLGKVDKVIRTQLEATQAAAKQQNDDASKYDNLWNGFLAVDGNDVWENEPEKVQVAALKVQKKLQAKGVDVNRYMFGNPEGFYAEVTKTLEADFGKPVVEEEDDDTGKEPDDTGAVDRTAGLMGGQISPATKGSGVKTAANAPDLLGDLVAIQRKGGFY